MQTARVHFVVGALLAAACGGGSTTTADSGTPLPDSGSDASAAATTVSGSADGTPFTSATTSLWIGSPDAADTTVVYVFSKPVACSELATQGWDKRITDATQFLEMKMFGTSPQAFKVTSSLTPAPGEASVNYTLSSKATTPSESSGTGGSVTLTEVVAKTHATGTFALDFGSNKLSGTYDAVYCPGGHEP